MGLKERFASRQLPQVVYPLRMDFGPDADAAERELTAAESELAFATSQGFVDLGGYRRRVEAARQARDGFYEFLTIRALPPSEFEELVGAHPASEEQRKKNGPAAVWNIDTFVPALLAACVESDMSADDWAEVTSKGPIATGEVAALFQAALQVNDRTPDEHLGKG